MRNDYWFNIAFRLRKVKRQGLKNLPLYGKVWLVFYYNDKIEEYVERTVGNIKEYIRLMRMHHYIKNFLVFAALACSGQLFCAEKFTAALIGFAAFCMLSSVIYIINDICDQEKDRCHPTKCNRPIASGRVSEKSACFLAIVLFLLTVFCDFLVFHAASSILLVLYLILNLAYSFGLKNIPLVDVSILVSGFLIRVIFGAIVTGIVISNWLQLTVIALAFYFSLGKRRNELKRGNVSSDTRKVLQYYSVDFLDKNMYMCLALANVFYALWCMDADTSLRYGTSLVFTVPIVLLIMMKYSMHVEGDSDGDPVEVLLHDRGLLVLCFLYFLAMFIILYFK